MRQKPSDNAVGGTYVGNPVAQAAAIAVLDVYEEEGLIERAAQIGEVIRGRMTAWQERHAQIGDVRGLGAMLAIELVRDRTTKEPADASQITAVVDFCRDRVSSSAAPEVAAALAIPSHCARRW